MFSNALCNMYTHIKYSKSISYTVYTDFFFFLAEAKESEELKPRVEESEVHNSLTL